MPALQASIAMRDLIPALRPGLPTDSPQNSWFRNLLATQVTTPVFGGGGPLFTAASSRLLLPLSSNQNAPAAGIEDIRHS